MTDEIIITKEKCEAYENIRLSGVTNMFNLSKVCKLSGLKEEEVKEIIRRYSELNKEFNFRK